MFPGRLGRHIASRFEEGKCCGRRDEAGHIIPPRRIAHVGIGAPFSIHRLAAILSAFDGTPASSETYCAALSNMRSAIV